MRLACTSKQNFLILVLGCEVLGCAAETTQQASDASTSDTTAASSTAADTTASGSQGDTTSWDEASTAGGDATGTGGPSCEEQAIANQQNPNDCPGNSKTELIEAVDLELELEDDAYNGKLNSMLCVDILTTMNVKAGLDIFRSGELRLGLDHEMVGDLTIKLISPEETVLTLLSRPGGKDLPDDGSGVSVRAANARFDIPWIFTDDAVTDAMNLGLGLGDDQTVCLNEDPPLQVCEFRPYPNGGPGASFADFRNENVLGTWWVCIGDSGAGDVGVLRYIGLELTRVKYPSE